MRLNLLTLIGICIVGLVSCSEQNIIEIPLIQKNGFGYFPSALSGVSPYSEDENNPWKETYLKVSGVPENWTEIKYGDIETNIYQSVYQNYILGNITQKRYEELQKSWDWKPDTMELSKEPLKTKIAFAYGKDSTGQLKMIVDANNNLDFNDDDSFIPFQISPNENINIDSIALNKAITVSYERFMDNKIVEVTTPLFIAYMSQFNMFMSNFPQYSIANFKGEKIAVCPDRFTNLSYKNPSIVSISDSLKDGDKISPENLISKNEFIEIKGVLYRNLGVNLNKNILILERINLSKNDLYSTQIGFKPPSFEGRDFAGGYSISLDELKGKYVLIDFWAVWCSPCLEEIPNLKRLYKMTDREDFEIVGIVGESSPESLNKIIIKDSINWPQILSTDSNTIREDYGVQGFPTSFLLNKEGFIIAKDLRGKELEEKVLGLLKE